MKYPSKMNRSILINSISTCLSVALAATALTGCTSKYQEKSPDKVSSAELTPDEKIARKQNSRESLARLKKAMEKADRVSILIAKIMEPYEKVGYSNLDFLKEVYREFYGAIPDESNGKIVRKIRFEIPETHREAIVPACHSLDLTLTHEKRQDPSLVHPYEAISMFAADCSNVNQGRPIEISVITETNRETKLSMNSKYIYMIMKPAANPKFQTGDMKCEIERDTDPNSKGGFKQVVCENINMNSATAKEFFIDKFAYSAQDLKIIAGANIHSSDLGQIKINLIGSSSAGWQITLKPDEVLAGQESETWKIGDVLISADSFDGEIRDLLRSIWESFSKIKQRLAAKK